MTDVKVITYDERHADAFVSLNLEWIETHFRVEAMDLAQLEGPREKILNEGGEIFFVLEGEDAVGTCALIPHGPGGFELAKMAVSPRARGRGYGDRLMKEALRWAREHGAEKVTLLSNTVLAPAITLYRKHGFKTKHLGQHPDYERCNIEMELAFEAR